MDAAAAADWFLLALLTVLLRGLTMLFSMLCR